MSKNEVVDIENIYKNIKEKIMIARGKMLKHEECKNSMKFIQFGQRCRPN